MANKMRDSKNDRPEFVKPERPIRIELINDHFQNYKRYQIPKAQLVIADIPYNVGKNAYGSNPTWYVGGGQQQWRIRQG